MEGVAIVIKALDVIVGMMLIFAILRIFSISSTLTKVLKQLQAMDKHRREEFEAAAGDGQ